MKPTELRENIHLFQTTNLIYLDSASATLVPNSILEKHLNYLQKNGGSNFRGVYKQAIENMSLIQTIRKDIAEFFNCQDLESVILHSGGTTLGTAICTDIFPQNTHILVDISNHHSGFLPWMKISRSITFIDPLTTEEGVSQLNDELKRKEEAIVIANHVPMITGDILDLRPISKLCKEHNSFLFLDGTRSVGHIPIHYQNIIDFFVCNSHIGLFGLESTGIALIPKTQSRFAEGHLSIFGEGTVKEVTRKGYELMEPPYRYEPDLGNIGGYISTQEGIKLIKQINQEKIRQHELKLISYFLSELENLPQVEIFGSHTAIRKGPIIGFAVKGINSHDVAMWLDGSTNIAIRSGLFCSHLFSSHLDPSQKHPGGFLQVSFAYYNTLEDLEHLIGALKEIIRTFS